MLAISAVVPKINAVIENKNYEIKELKSIIT
jgi:hypothetical protein